MPNLYAWGVGSRLVTIWGSAYIKVRQEEEFTLADAATVAGATTLTAFILTPKWSNSVLGWSVRAVVTNPLVQALTAITVTGALVSKAIDPKDGLDNYLGFITGGVLGERDPNYFTGDTNDSGYFNVPQNARRIAMDKAPKNISLLSKGIVWFQDLANQSNEYDDTH